MGKGPRTMRAAGLAILFLALAATCTAQQVSGLGGACAAGEYDAGVVSEQGQASDETNCQACANLVKDLFGGKGRVKGNGNCEKDCGECERPSPHPVHGSICWSAVSDNGDLDPLWVRNEDPDLGTVGGCVCRSDDNVCRGTQTVDGVTTWFCRQTGMRYKKGENGDCVAPGALTPGMSGLV